MIRNQTHIFFKAILVLCLFLFGKAYPQSTEDIDFDNLSSQELKKIIQQRELLSKSQELDSVNIEDNLLAESNAEKVRSFRFGHDFFSSENINRAPILDIPLISDYRLSFNDTLELTLVGGKSEIIDLRVDLSGAVILPEIGKVNLLNLSLKEANEKISSIISDTYIGTRSYLTVKEASLKKISIIGAVKNPGTYIVNPFLSISEAIKYAGGVEEYASLRNIEVVSANGDRTLVDMYDFLIFGDRSTDLNLNNGDTLLVNSTSNYFSLEGAINRPMEYEYLFSDTVSSLISFGLGLKRESDLDSIYLNLYNESDIETLKAEPSSKINRHIDSMYIGSKYFNQNREAKVVGNAIRDGYLSYEEGGNVSDLIGKLDYGENIFPYGFVIRQDTFTNGKLKKEIFKASLSDKKTYEDKILGKNVELYFFSLDDIAYYSEALLSLDKTDKEKDDKGLEDQEGSAQSLEEKNKDEVLNILKSIKLASLSVNEETFAIPLAGEFYVSDVVDLFINSDIDKGNITLVTDQKHFSNAYNIKISEGSRVENIIAPKLSSDLINVVIEGNVLYPGQYQISSKAKLFEIFNTAGGLIENSNENGIVLTRKSIRDKEFKAFQKRKELFLDLLISQSANKSSVSGQIDPSIFELFNQYDEEQFAGRYAGDLSVGSFNYFNLELQDGDKIFVPKISNEVTISGEVLSPSAVIYMPNRKISDYILKAGGLTDFADRRNIYVILANGTTINSSDYILQPGDTIVVPKDLTKINSVDLISSLTRIFSDLALSVASLNILRN